jgi:hypothetical protein
MNTANASAAEIQGPYRRPATTPTHGFLGWCCACKYRKSSDYFFRTENTDREQMADKENMWISKQEWEEQGTRALEKLGAR